MKFKDVAVKLGQVFFKVKRAEKQKAIEECGCPCHTDQPWISHFVPCCKYTSQKK